MKNPILPKTHQKLYGRLSVIGEPYKKEYGTKGRKATFIECLCICGVVKNYRLDHLKDGRSQSCGCLQRQNTSKSNKTHGHSVNGRQSSEYSIWRSMISRCTNSNNGGFNHYGGRGIKVSKRWQKFENFLHDMGLRPDGMSLDRIDVNGSYCRENCRWSTAKEQANNTRRNILVTAFGKTQTLAQWSEEVNIKYNVLWFRLVKFNWPPEKALTTKTRSISNKSLNNKPE